MADLKAQFLPLLATVASAFLISGSVHSSPSPPSHLSSSRAPSPQLHQHYPTTSQRPPSSPYPPSTSSLAPTSPVYTAQRIRPNSYSDSAEYDDPYPASAHLGVARTTSGVAQTEEEDAPQNTGFVEAIDFSSLLKDVGSSPSKGIGLDIGASNSNPLFASESKDTFQGFFGSTKNPFEELSRLNTASSDHNSKRQNGDEDNVGFVDPNVQFRSLFDSAGPSASSTGFRPQDFLGSKSENIGSDPSKGSQTRSYPSFTYSGKQDGDREDSERDDYYNGGGPNRYRSSYRQVGDGGGSSNYYPPTSDSNPDYDASPGGGPYDDDYERISNNSPPDSYDDDRRGDGGGGPSYYASSPGPSSRGGGGYERPTPRYSPTAQETSNSPQTKPRAAESKNPRCKKVEKAVDYSDDHASYTDPEPDYDPSTYQGRYKRQARQARGGRGGGGSKRPMTCYVCEDEHGRYAEKCSYDSKGSPSKNGDGNYFHSESSSFSDNGRRPNSGSGGGRSKERTRRNPGGNRQRQQYTSADTASAESTTKPVSVKSPVNVAEIAESEPKVIEKRQSGSGGFDDDDGENNRGGEDNDPYDARTGAYRRPNGYEGPPLSAIGGAGTNRGGFHGRGGGGHGGGGGFHSDGGFHGGRGDDEGRGGGGEGRGGGRDNDEYDSDFNFDAVPDFEREAAQSTREFDFTIPREFDPDVQLGPQGGRSGGGRGGSNRAQGHQSEGDDSSRRNSFQPQYHHNPNRRGGPQQSTSASNRREALDDFDIGYSDYVKQNFPEAFDSPSFGAGASPSFSPSNYEYTPNYYHRPRSNHGGGGGRHNDDDRGNSPEVSHSSSNDNYGRGHRGGGGGGRGGFVPDKQHTQPSHNFAPPPGFFTEDGPGQENYENLGKIMNDFSSRSRDGCQKVNKGDMTCYVCRDAKGMKKEECMYASNDPKNKAMAYHEVAEYSSPTASVLPAPLHATLLGQHTENNPIFSIEQADSDGDSGDDSTLSAQASSIFQTSTPAAPLNANDDKKTKSASTTSVVTAKAPLSSSTSVVKTMKASSISSNKDKDKDKKNNVRSVKSSRIVQSATVIVHERLKRSLRQTPKNRKIPSEENYDFDY